MKGLLYKDLISLRGNLKVMGILIFMFCIIFISQGNSVVYGITILMLAMMVVTSMALDDQAKWNEYALTMPVTRKEIVLSKYLSALFLVLGGTVISIIIALLSSFFIKTELGLLETLGSIGLIALLALIFISVMIPLTYKFGTEKARLLIIAVGLIPTGIVLILGKYFNISINISETNFWIIAMFILVGSLLLIVGSYFISLRIFYNKEF